jgi:TolA-binding protein
MSNKSSFIFYLILITAIGCAYFNILFNAESRYESGIKKIEESKDKKITSDIRNDFQAAIDKCWKLLNLYSDSSKYADDALLLIGKSHYHIEEYTKSERFLSQFVDRYRDSDMIYEAHLWLGMALIELDRDNEAIENLNKAIEGDESNDLNARAYLNLGRIYIKRESYDQARKQLMEVFELTGNDQYEGDAQFLIGESFFLNKEYSEAITNYEKVLNYDASVDLLYRAILRIVDSHIYLDQYEQAISTLEKISSEAKFLYKKSVILSIIGNCYKDQGKSIEATEIYMDVLESYPRTEGSAIAAYGLGQLMEFAYSDLDSAKSLYLRVGKEFRDSEYKVDADNRAKIITSYQKIISDIEKDLSDLATLRTESEDQDSLSESIIDEETQENGEVTPEKDQKSKVKRSEKEILLSLQRHNFAKAEFFLLTLANYDSAEAAYMKFIEESKDSLLVPKAHYALYYIYWYEINDQRKADSLKQIILTDYPESPYAAYLTNQEKLTQSQDNEESPYKFIYLQGEAMMSDERYPEAIDFFNQIAEEDSGSELAQKARFATAWIYENKMDDIEGAVSAYTVLAAEYPNSKAGKIAINKIQVPAQLEADSTGTNADSTLISPTDSTMIEGNPQLNSPSQERQVENRPQEEREIRENDRRETPENTENP